MNNDHLTKRKGPKSMTKRAKSLIRGEISSFYGPAMTGSKKRAIKAMREDAESYNCGSYRKGLSDWQKGSGLVDAGCFRIWHDEQREFLAKIYGKKRVAKWPGDKVHKTYASLIGREYAAMLKPKKRKASGGRKGGKR